MRKTYLKQRIITALLLPILLGLSFSQEKRVSIPDAAERTKIIQKIHIDKLKLTHTQKKLSTDILPLIDTQFLNETIDMDDYIKDMKKFKHFRAPEKATRTETQIEQGEVYVYIYLYPNVHTDIVNIYIEDGADKDEMNHIVAAWVKIIHIEALASLEGVRTLRTVMPPVHRSGSVTTKGDTIHRSLDVRSIYAQSGSGVKIGIISDGVDSRSSAQSTGDLPPDGSGLTVLSNTEGGDEGTAMLEIVYDMVPEADLYFHDCGSNVIAFNAAIDNLVSSGCDVLCDDICWIYEPFFEDGTVASHISSVLSSDNIIYVSSAGNNAYEHYQGEFYPDTEDPDFHDFSEGSDPTFKDLYVNIPNGSSVLVILQWNDAFGSSGNDYNMMLYSEKRKSIVAAQTNVQDGDDDPLESIIYTASHSTAGIFQIWVTKETDSDVKILEVFIYTIGSAVYTNNMTPADAIFGHPAIPGVIAVGAIDASDPGNDDIEPFSSHGPATIHYPSPETRSKPDVCGTDGVSVTGAGGFYNPFFGTSAAAPHVAAVAAQLWAQLSDNTGNEIRDMVTGSAIDLGSGGFDTIFGYGRVDALNAFNYHVFVADPVFSPLPGLFDTPQDIAISCTTSGAMIHYTMNGEDPTEIDPVYGSPVHIASTMTLKAKAYKTGWNASDVTSGIYTISIDDPPEAPQNLTAAPGDQEIALCWSPNSESDLHKYNIYRGTSSPASVLIDSAVSTGSGPDTSFTDTGLTNGQPYFYRITVVDSSKNESGFSNEVNATPNPFVLTKIKVFLEGSYQAGGDTMSTTLNAGHFIPLESPYGDGRHTEEIPDDIVDWVLIELRETADGAAVTSKSFFIRKDGMVVDLDGTTTELPFEGVSEGDYYIVVRHRNHLSVMSAEAQALGP